MAIRKFSNNELKGYSYRYDQLNRLRNMRVDNIPEIGFSNWIVDPVEAYKEDITYDGNGNIKTYVRNGANNSIMPLGMDNLTFNYYDNSNKHRQIIDLVPATNYTQELNQTEDIDDQSNSSNYGYSKTGQLIKNTQEGISLIEWTVNKGK